MWLHRLTGVGAVAPQARKTMRSSLASVSVYSADTSSAPGKPSSPSCACSEKTTPASPARETTRDAHTRLSKPTTPPCSVLGPLLRAVAKTRPPAEKAPPAMRFATRPTVAP